MAVGGERVALAIEAHVLVLRNAARTPGLRLVLVPQHAAARQAAPGPRLVAWVRGRLASTTPTVPWEETPEDFAKRLHEATDFANANYDGSGLRRELNWRLEQLVKVTLGDRLKK